jgi:hypothetical protein
LAQALTALSAIFFVSVWDSVVFVEDVVEVVVVVVVADVETGVVVDTVVEVLTGVVEANVVVDDVDVSEVEVLAWLLEHPIRLKEITMIHTIENKIPFLIPENINCAPPIVFHFYFIASFAR